MKFFCLAAAAEQTGMRSLNNMAFRGLIILAILVAVILIARYFLRTKKEMFFKDDLMNPSKSFTNRSKDKSEFEKKYAETQGTIKSVESIPYYVTPYQKAEENSKDDSISKSLYSQPFVTARKSGGNKHKYNKQLMDGAFEEMLQSQNFKSMLDEESPKKIEKIKYRVCYEYKIPDSEEIFTGDFTVFQKKEDVYEGGTIRVMYNKERPFASYTDYCSPMMYM